MEITCMAPERRDAIIAFMKPNGMMNDIGGNLIQVIQAKKLEALDAHLMQVTGEGLSAEDFVVQEKGTRRAAEAVESALIYNPEAVADNLRYAFGGNVGVNTKRNDGGDALTQFLLAGGVDQEIIFPTYHETVFEFLHGKGDWFTAEQLMRPAGYPWNEPFPTICHIMEFGGMSIFEAKYWQGRIEELETLGRMMKEQIPSFSRQPDFDDEFSAMVEAARNYDPNDESIRSDKVATLVAAPPVEEFDI